MIIKMKNKNQQVFVFFNEEWNHSEEDAVNEKE